MNTSNRDMMLYDANKKGAGVAYLLWFFLGGLGGHRYYAGKTGTAAVMTGLFVLGWLTAAIGIGIFMLVVVGIWSLVDAFLIPGLIREYNTELALKMS